MAEIGGQTLNLSYWKNYPTTRACYGICQWAGARKRRLLNNFGAGFEAQVDFMLVEMNEIFPIGDYFWSIQNEKEAALVFAKRFERCSSRSYNKRQYNATKALSYIRGID